MSNLNLQRVWLHLVERGLELRITKEGTRGLYHVESFVAGDTGQPPGWQCLGHFYKQERANAFMVTTLLAGKFNGWEVSYKRAGERSEND